MFWEGANWWIQTDRPTGSFLVDISEKWANRVEYNLVSAENPVIITSKSNINRLSEHIMDTETPCRVWLKGDCKKYREGTCDLAHIKEFCQSGKNCKDETCLNGFQRRHVIKCSERQRWRNGEQCKFPLKWKACSFWHPELGKAKVRKKECKKCDKN